MRENNLFFKRFCSILLTIAVALSMMPTMAWAEANEAAGLQEILDGAQEGGRIQLTDNFVLSSDITTTANVTLDLNGHSIDLNEKAFNIASSSFSITDTNSETAGSITNGTVSVSGRLTIPEGAGMKIGELSVAEGGRLLRCQAENLEKSALPARAGACATCWQKVCITGISPEARNILERTMELLSAAGMTMLSPSMHASIGGGATHAIYVVRLAYMKSLREMKRRVFMNAGTASRK